MGRQTFKENNKSWHTYQQWFVGYGYGGLSGSAYVEWWDYMSHFYHT